jgi:hypothetical protein
MATLNSLQGAPKVLRDASTRGKALARLVDPLVARAEELDVL